MRKLIPLLVILPLSACMLGGTATAVVEPPGQTAEPATAETATAQPTTAPPTPEPLVFAPEDPGKVVLDFTADLCSAEWSNSGIYLPCPGDINDTSEGFVEVVDSVLLTDGSVVHSPGLLMIPPHGSRFGGLFGAYPALNIYPGDHFKAVLACQQSDSACAISYGLHYYDASGNFYQVSSDLGPAPVSSHNPLADSWTEVDIDLSYLAGYDIRFVLTIRTEGDPLPYPALWIAPRIERDPSAEPVIIPPMATASGAEPSGSDTEENNAPGVIRGRVDMASAPPYLLDPQVYGTAGKPVVVMFFNLDDHTWWWIHSTLTHPFYQMTVPPGEYHVVAFAQGVGEVDYVTGGYTGSNPSCGQALQVVNVPPETIVEDIVIADWNWSCGGTAYRPAKPSEVPLP